ncbi:unnamed protein product [Pseudo-nitzschia multistriata]|uniref:AAA+ ATPase domain-containing protein n=1 Tax=Pseudo-nitzschia multistriata TaxID=183589 RepID=A0A448ZS34_9STRA|nr:unnamed protein product [Pseudo-nitzschia multistriata]
MSLSGKAKDNSNLPWVEKYRPERLEDLVAHEKIVNIITTMIDNDNLPHLLLYGPPGTGKTSTIVAAAKRMYGASKYSSMTLELNASDARGIGVVRNEIKEFAGTQQLFSRGVKLIILDEADAMTSDAQFALRRVIEKYTKNARFCLICNYVSKIIPALQSRCTRFRFAPLAPSQIRGRLEEVAREEKVPITKDGVEAILDLSGGDMRRVLNLLQSTAMSLSATRSSVAATSSDMEIDDENASRNAAVDEIAVYTTSGSPLPKDIDEILASLLNDSFRDSCNKISEMCTTNGYALADILKQLTLKLCAMKGLDSIPLGRLLDGMSQVECRLAMSGIEEKIQTASLVGVFVETRERLEIKQ